MQEEDEESPEEFFPAVESFPDFTGEKREFVIELEVQSRGYFLRANEKRRTGDEGGYAFAAYSPSDPFNAYVRLAQRKLGVLRGEIRRGLATRYLVMEFGRGT